MIFFFLKIISLEALAYDNLTFQKLKPSKSNPDCNRGEALGRQLGW